MLQKTLSIKMIPKPKQTEPVVLIIVTSLVVYGIIRGKKLDYLGHKLRHHIVKPTMKARRAKSLVERELKREVAHPSVPV